MYGTFYCSCFIFLFSMRIGNENNDRQLLLRSKLREKLLEKVSDNLILKIIQQRHYKLQHHPMLLQKYVCLYLYKLYNTLHLILELSYGTAFSCVCIEVYFHSGKRETSSTYWTNQVS